mmetsp:Transcript_20671/g.29677  ORF Transcript_20671/g.29677 Transcript_20671/m.29677 type:complete len:1492 (+) Transcript_20671:118-4593(+)
MPEVNKLTDIATLHLETQALIDEVRSVTKKKKNKSAFNVDVSKKGFDYTKPKYRGTKRKMTSSLDLGKTKNLYDTSSRVTVEVLDDASPDNTPRLDYDDNKQSRKDASQNNAQKAKSLQDSENIYRQLKFHSEKGRVLKNDDTFVPAPGITSDDVEAERTRLVVLEESARTKQRVMELDKSGRRDFLEQDISAAKIQSAFRGMLGRRKFMLTHRLTQMTGGAVAEWVECRDNETGDVWYYNTINGSSQWEKPDILKGKLVGSESVKKLPALTDKSSKKSKHHLKMSTSESLPLIKTTGGAIPQSTTSPTRALGDTTQSTWAQEYEDGVDPYEQEQIQMELNDALGVGDMNDDDALLDPSGSFKPQLKETIQAALAQTRFDSVSSVMADQRWLEGGTKATTGVRTGKGIQKRHLVDPSRKPMAAVMTINKPKTGAGVRLKQDEEETTRAAERTGVAALTIGNVNHAGFDVKENQQPSNMCFGCWSAGSKKACAMHEDIHTKKHKSQSMLLCRNWELDVMRRRYRSEEIQELFMKKASSLKYDNKRKKFVAVVEQRHPIYRAVKYLLEKFNMRSMLTIKCQRWLHSFAEEIRMGAVKPQRTAEKARLLRLKRSVTQWAEVSKYTGNVMQLLPIAPTTGYSWPERVGSEQFLFTHPDPALGMDVQLIVAPPTPVPIKLYELHEFHLPAPKSIPMPKPDYSEESRVKKIAPSNQYIDDITRAAWLERMASGLSREAVHNAVHQVDSLTPIPGLHLMQRTKYPNPSSVKFASIGRKPTPGMLARGGLCMELLISQLVTTYVPPQYGSFMVMDKSTISPGISPEITITFQSLPMAPILQVYVARHLEHPLNYRRSPTITINTKAKLDEKFMYGENRPEQTGERESHGFRTTAWARHLLTNVDTDPKSFTPGAEVISLNLPAANPPYTTHADHTYPFCEPSTRDNTTLDFYHLLLTGCNSSPKAQVFTVITDQDPGDFQRMANIELPLGHVLVSVYRSWAYMQRHKIEEFKSDDGIPYWYHRETGQTFWERPLVEEEEVSPLHGGTVVDPNHDEEPFIMHKGAPGQTRRYNQGELRKNLMIHHETEEEATRRRKAASASAKVARQKGKLPDLEEGMSRVVNPSTIEGDMSAHSHDLASVVEEKKTGVPPIAIHNPLKQEYNPALPSPAESERSRMSTESSLVSSNPNHNPYKASTNNSRLPTQGTIDEAGEESTTVQQESSGVQSSQNDVDGIHQQSSAADSSYASSSHKPKGIDPVMVHNLTMTLGQMMAQMDLRNAKPQDMVQLGLGMGMAMMQQTMGVPNVSVAPSGGIGSEDSPSQGGQKSVGFGGDDMSVFSEDSSGSFPHQGMQPTHGYTKEPIGLPKAQVPSMESITLHHEEEKEQKEKHKKLDNTPLTALENALELKVQVSATPDELNSGGYFDVLPKNADEAVKKNVPVLVYPELSSCTPGGAPAEFTTHAPSGIGTSFVLKKDERSQTHVGDTDMRRMVNSLPVGFFF